MPTDREFPLDNPKKGLLKLFTAITIEHHIDEVKLNNDSMVIH